MEKHRVWWGAAALILSLAAAAALAACAAMQPSEAAKVGTGAAQEADPSPASPPAASPAASGDMAAAPSGAMAAPSEAMAAPSEAMAAPSEAMAAPAEAMAAPAEAQPEAVAASKSKGMAFDGPVMAEKASEEYAQGGGGAPEGAATAPAGPAPVQPADVQPAVQPRPEPREEKGTTRYLSADDSNSMASAAIVRRLIRAGRYVPPALVRTYEFLNYYTFDYPAPAEAPVAVIPQMRPVDAEPGRYTLQVAVRSRDRLPSEMPPLRLTVLLDTSGSMAGEPLDTARAFLRALAARLRPEDRVSLVTCNRKAGVLLEDGTAAQLEGLLPGLEADDITDLQQGVLAAYGLAEKGYGARSLNRVVVVSDGADNAGGSAVEAIARCAEDSDRQGIYLVGIGVGEGFNDQLMDAFTDKGRGAYAFLDTPGEVERLLAPERFASVFDLAAKNVRLKMVMPPGWEMVEFHGEQVSAKASEVTPQYLAPGDQMIYHLVLSCARPPAEAEGQEFTFEAEYTPLPGRPARLEVRAPVGRMLGEHRGILKGDAVVEYAELLKKVRWPLAGNSRENLADLAAAVTRIGAAQAALRDPELEEVLALLAVYRRTLAEGERFPGSRDRDALQADAALGIDPSAVRRVSVSGARPELAVQALERLGASTRLVPLEGYRFLALSTGPVGSRSPAGSGELGGAAADPAPEFLGRQRSRSERRQVFDLHQVRLELQAPPWARSFSFDFDFFSAEYPMYVNQSFNDTFYAVLEAPSTNGGRPTGISFDANGNSIEVDNNYFEQPFHPIPNTGTGFDVHGSTGWLRTHWPIRGGERFTLTFSIHDEGDAIFDSLVLLDNFRWHDYEAVGTTDPLN